MLDFLSRQYELTFKIFLIFVTFLFVSIMLGYYWLVMESHSANNAELIDTVIGFYYQARMTDHDNSSRELKFKNITEILADTDRSFLITVLSAGKETPVIWNGPPDNSDPNKILEMFRSNSSSVITLKTRTQHKNLYYIPDDMISKMKFYPFFLILSLVLVSFTIFYLFMFIRKNEKQSIWIAMSKETAHQLGTPLTSLKGWKEHLSLLGKNNDELNGVADGLADDIDKISTVVNRFSNISSDKDFRMCDTGKILERAADYISKRLPLDHGKISLKKNIKSSPQIYANEVLLEWTIENLLKNSMESLHNRSTGVITISQYEEKDRIIIEVSDNGDGIPSSIRKNIFETGFTTKKRGWGLGLSLSKKVIEQYHKGKLYIKQTGPEGTVMRIELNKYI